MDSTPERSTRVQTAVLAVLVLFSSVGASCGGISNLGAVRNTSDEALQAIHAAAGPAELRTASQRLDDLLRGIEQSGLSAEERAVVEAATQRSAVLNALARQIAAPEGWTSTFREETLQIMRASWRREITPPEYLVKHMDDATETVLRDTVCSVFAEVMNSDAADRAKAQELLAASPYGAATEEGVREQLTVAVEFAGSSLAWANHFADVGRLPRRILTAAEDKVGRLEKLIDATAWRNGGAIYYYVRYCVNR